MGRAWVSPTRTKKSGRPAPSPNAKGLGGQTTCPALIAPRSALAMADLNSPQYLTLQEMIDNVTEIIENSIPVVAPKLQARRLVNQADAQGAINSVSAGGNNGVIAQKLMQPVQMRVKYVPDSFYDLVDALNASSLIVPIGEMLEERCSEFLDTMQICTYTNHCPFFPSSIESKGGRRPQQGRMLGLGVIFWIL